MMISEMLPIGIALGLVPVVIWLPTKIPGPWLFRLIAGYIAGSALVASVIGFAWYLEPTGMNEGGIFGAVIYGFLVIVAQLVIHTLFCFSKRKEENSKKVDSPFSSTSRLQPSHKSTDHSP